MNVIRCGFWLFLIGFSSIDAQDSCTNQIFLSSSAQDVKIQTKVSSFKDCSKFSFEKSEKLSSHLGSISLSATVDDQKAYSLNISFRDIKWKRAFLKLSQENHPETSICKEYSAEVDVQFPVSEVFDSCFNLDSYNTSVNYIFEFKGVLNTDILYKKLIFRFPPLESFENTTSLPKRSIFTSVDTSSNYGIVLKVQTLPVAYNVSYYKVEVFRYKENSDTLLDVRMLNAGTNKELSFEYITYNEEGYYFFKVSAFNDVCPEDSCLKTVSPTVYIRRKYPPLVIGIVGASFLIPFVLFILHMWTRRKQFQDENEEQKDKIFLICNQTPEKHYVNVKALEKCLKSLANVQIVTKISEASYILYICGVYIFEPDPIAHKFLVIEANKAISNVEILVISFPYSTREVPPYLKNCLRFELMDDFCKLIHVFNCDAEFEENAQYKDLCSKVNAAQIQTEPKKIILNMPIIIVTEQSDSDTEPREGDVLL